MLSHLTALIRSAGLIVHRRDGFALGVEPLRYRDGLPVTPLEPTLVDSWPLLLPERRREPIIKAVSGRRTTAKRVRQALDSRPRLTDRQSLARLLHLLEVGCHSALEIWGYEHVFRGPGMPEFRRQVPMRLGGRTGPVVEDPRSEIREISRRFSLRTQQRS